MQRILFQLSAFLLGLSAWGNSSFDPDLGWHLFGGSWITSHGQLPTVDFINLFRPFWHDYHWLGQIILFSFYDFGGLDALRFLQGIVGGLLGLLIFSVAEKSALSSPQPIRTFALTAISVLIVRPYLFPRPQIFTFVLIAWIVGILIERPARFQIVSVLFAAVLCLNLHVNWVVMPVLWFATRTLPAFLYRESFFRSLGGLALLCVVGLSDPYALITGEPLINYTLLQEYAALPTELRGSIGEMRRFSQATMSELFLFFALFIPTIFATRSPKGRERSVALATASVGIVLVCSMLKFLPIFAILSIPAATRGMIVIEAMVSRQRQILSRRIQQFLAVIVLAVSLALVVVGSPFLFNSNRNLFIFLPQAACESAGLYAFESANLSKPLRVLTHFNDGGWCRWFAFARHPEVDLRVTTDGRTQDISNALVMKSFELYALGEGWEQTLSDWSPDLALVPKATPLAAVLRDRLAWPIVSESPFHYLFRAVAHGGEKRMVGS